MWFKKDDKVRYFAGVAIATLLLGAACFAFGLVEFAMNLWDQGGYDHAIFLVLGGLIITSLGYIQLELELIRTK